MSKCVICKSCLDVQIINNVRYLACWLCKKYYIVVDNKLVDVTLELKEKGWI